ncbi:hypothetical protein RUND412_000755 [Rhizina undulata]
MAVIASIVRRYDAYFDAKPVVTMMITNSVLNGIADTVAQTVTIIRERAVRKPGGITPDDVLAIELHELDEKLPLPHPPGGLIPDKKGLPPPFDFERLFRFMAWGCIIAPVQLRWLQFLNRNFPPSKTGGIVAPLKKVALDQIIFAPAGLGAFFSYMTLAEGGSRKDVVEKLDNVYFTALKSNYMVWPMVQMINFRLMPLRFQLPFGSSIGILWGVYLSLANAAAEV